MVELLIGTSTIIDATNAACETPLWDANERIARALLCQGADARKVDKDSRTLLFNACPSGRRTPTIDAVQLLLDRGSDIEYADKFGTTPLLWASRHDLIPTTR
jgi:ankyrin repeat protein